MSGGPKGPPLFVATLSAKSPSSSSPAKAGYPVRCGLSVQSLASLEYGVTRPSAQLRTRRVTTTVTASPQDAAKRKRAHHQDV